MINCSRYGSNVGPKSFTSKVLKGWLRHLPMTVPCKHYTICFHGYKPTTGCICRKISVLLFFLTALHRIAKVTINVPQHYSSCCWVFTVMLTLTVYDSRTVFTWTQDHYRTLTGSHTLPVSHYHRRAAPIKSLLAFTDWHSLCMAATRLLPASGLV